jgi:hypothetical protein
MNERYLMLHTRFADLLISAPLPTSNPLEGAMNTKSKVVILEFIGGLFGWAWIIASLSGQYFIVMAVGFNGKWSKVFWAFGIAAI